MTTNTDIIRLKLASITDLVADIAEACTDIDNEIPPEEPEEPEEPPEEPEEPGTPQLPPAVDCLAGTIPNLPSGLLTANPPNWTELRNTFRTTMKNAPSGSILFIGDSQIATFDTSLVTPFGVKLGISGESSRHALWRLNETDIDGQPNLIHRCGAAVIETFVNDLGDSASYGSSVIANDTIIPYMLAWLAPWVSGKTVIMCPTKVGQRSPAFWTSNTAIETLNTAIKAKFAGRSDVRVVDINPIIAPNGWLLSQYSPDYHHLNHDAQVIKAAAWKAALLDLGVPASALAP